MISDLSISGFKSLVDPISIRFSPLTVVTGPNSSGKSSVLQGILVLKQTAEQPPYDATLRLNGPYGSLGTDRIISGPAAEVSLEWTDAGGSSMVFRIRVVPREGESAIELVTGPDNSELVRSEPTESERTYLSEREGEIFEGGPRRFVVCGITVTHEIKDVARYTTAQNALLKQRCDDIVSEYVRETLASDVELSSSGDSGKRGFDCPLSRRR